MGEGGLVGLGVFMLHPVAIIRHKRKRLIVWIMESLYSNVCVLLGWENLSVMVYFPLSVPLRMVRSERR